MRLQRAAALHCATTSLGSTDWLSERIGRLVEVCVKALNPLPDQICLQGYLRCAVNDRETQLHQTK